MTSSGGNAGIERVGSGGQPLGGNRSLRIGGNQTLLVHDAERVEKALQHRPLVREVIADEQPSRERIRHLGEGDEIARLLLERKSLHELRPRLQVARDERHRLDLLLDAVAFLPERLRGEEALRLRHLLPQPRRLDGGLSIGHGGIIAQLRAGGTAADEAEGGAVDGTGGPRRGRRCGVDSQRPP